MTEYSSDNPDDSSKNQSTDSNDESFESEFFHLDHRTAWWMYEARFAPDEKDRVWTQNTEQRKAWARRYDKPLETDENARSLGNRKKIIQVCCSPSELERIKRAAERDGKLTSTWCRDVLMKAARGNLPKRAYIPFKPGLVNEYGIKQWPNAWRLVVNATVPDSIRPARLQGVLYDTENRIYRDWYGQKLFDKITRAPYIPEGWDIDGNNLTGDSTHSTDIAIPSAQDMFAAVISQSEERERMRAMSKPVPGKSEWAGVIAERIAREQGPEELARIERARNARGKPHKPLEDGEI